MTDLIKVLRNSPQAAHHIELWFMMEKLTWLSNTLILGVQHWHSKPESTISFLKAQGLTDEEIENWEKVVAIVHKGRWRSS